MSKKTVKQVAPFLILLGVAVAAIFVSPSASFDPASVLGEDGKSPKYVYNSGDIAWMLVSCAFVFLMTPALAFFYGGMVGRKNVLSTMIKSPPGSFFMHCTDEINVKQILPRTPLQRT